MTLSHRELWTALHGMLFGGVFLLLFTGGWLALASVHKHVAVYLWKSALFAWITVFIGTWIIYPWYRAKPPPGADIAGYPKYVLLAKPETTDWHEFGMEWKEHIAWFTPILATGVAFVASRHRARLAEDKLLRRVALTLFGICFASALVAGAFGALINKAAPTR
jgi:hypothetical protein